MNIDIKRLMATLAFLGIAGTLQAGSATWNQNPTSNDWNTAANWTPETVPNQSVDTATFDTSDVTSITIGWPGIAIGQIVFDPGASAYSIGGDVLGLSGVGVVNNSGVTQNFDFTKGSGFGLNATAGDQVVYTNYGGGSANFFAQTSNAGTATFILKGDTADHAQGLLLFIDQSSAATGTLINEAGDSVGGRTEFLESSTAGNCTLTLAAGAVCQFDNDAMGGTATLIADGGEIFFRTRATGKQARVELTNGGLLDTSAHVNTSPMTIGSLEGDSTGTVRLGTQKLSIGGNGISTTFAGLITMGGSLVKTGNETLSLTGANTYRGGTTITGGTLLAQARGGSATGSGAVNVNAGTLAGKGSISGAVTVGTGTGTGAYLAPGTKGPDILTTGKALTFKADGRYKNDLSLGQAKADQVTAKGVTIETGAQFVLQPKGFQTLTVGTVFTVINNTAATPISGVFANLADGAIINATAGNRLQASYTGGDGNDLTLTVVP